jgi:hypothetical protein
VRERFLGEAGGNLLALLELPPRLTPAELAGVFGVTAAPGPELAELNTLRAAHGEQAFGAALGRAVAFGRWRAADVRSILATATRPVTGSL